MTVKELIEMLEEIEGDTLPVELVIAGYSTDNMWVDIVNEKVYLGTT